MQSYSAVCEPNAVTCGEGGLRAEAPANPKKLCKINPLKFFVIIFSHLALTDTLKPQQKMILDKTVKCCMLLRIINSSLYNHFKFQYFIIGVLLQHTYHFSLVRKLFRKMLFLWPVSAYWLFARFRHFREEPWCDSNINENVTLQYELVRVRLFETADLAMVEYIVM